MDFKIVVDESLLNLGLLPKECSGNTRILSAVNDFEDGSWRLEKFVNFIWDNIAQTALTEAERSALRDQPQSLLAAAARNLRLTDKDPIGEGSELAEVVLYGLMRHKYKALPVVPKIFYKQNSQDNAKGADSVHISLKPDGDFSLWFGEAKFYNNIENARLGKIVNSVKNSLKTDKLKKENAIIVNLHELDDLGVEKGVIEKIKTALGNKESIDNIKNKINIPILLLHECPLTGGVVELSDDYLEKVKVHHHERAQAYFERQAKALGDVFKHEEVSFHLILFPVPQKEAVVNSFVSGVEFYKG